MMTYRKLIQQNPIGLPQTCNAAEWQLDPVTPHRWISTLGRFDTITRQALDSYNTNLRIYLSHSILMIVGYKKNEFARLPGYESRPTICL